MPAKHSPLYFPKVVSDFKEEKRYLEELQRKSEENQMRVAEDRARRKQEHIKRRVKEIIIAIAFLPAVVLVFKLIVILRLCL